MAVLEARAQKIAEEEGSGAMKNVIAGANIRFVRGESKTAQVSVTENPDEINIDEDEEDDGEEEQQMEEGKPFIIFSARMDMVRLHNHF